MKRFNILPGMNPEDEIGRHPLANAKKRFMNKLIPANTNPMVKTLVSSACTAILEHYNITREQTPTDSGMDLTGMTKAQAEEYIQDIKDNLDKMVSEITFLK